MRGGIIFTKCLLIILPSQRVHQNLHLGTVRPLWGRSPDEERPLSSSFSVNKKQGDLEEQQDTGDKQQQQQLTADLYKVIRRVRELCKLRATPL